MNQEQKVDYEKIDYQSEIADIEKMFESFEKNKQEDQEKKSEEPSYSTENEEEHSLEEQESENQEELEDEEESEEQKEKARIERKLKEHRWFKRNNYKLQHQINELNERNRELAQRLEDSTFLGTEHYAESAELKLKATKEKMKEAMRSGNEEEYIDLQEELYKATHEINQAKLLREQNERYRYQEKPQAQVIYDSAKEQEDRTQDIINDWVLDNPEINPNSKSFDKKLYNKLYDHVSDLNEELRLSGRTDLYLSPSYFKNLDNKLEKLKRSSYVPTSVGSVRNSYSAARNVPKKIILSAAELDLINSSNGVISEEGYIKQKLIDLKNGERR